MLLDERSHTGRQFFADPSGARRAIQPSRGHLCDRYPFSPEALVRPKPTAHTASDTAKNFSPNVSA